MRRLQFTASLVFLTACDATVIAAADPKPEVVVAADAAVVADAAVATDAKVEIAADAFKLDRVTTLIQDGKIESAADLEVAINDPAADINRVDIDGDGEVDHVEVVEVRSDAKVDFQLRVIPSSRPTVTHAVDLATASVVAARASSEIAFSASFSAGVSFSGGANASAQVHSFVTPARFEASAVIVTQPLFAWAFVAERPVYHSIYIEEKSGRWIPPGHVKHGLWKATGEAHGGGHGKFKVDDHAGVGGHGKSKGKIDFDDDDGPGHAGKSNSKHSTSSAPKAASKPEPKGGGAKGGGAKGGGAKGGGGSKGKNK